MLRNTQDTVGGVVRVIVNKAWLKLMVLSVTRSKDLIVLSNQQ